MKDRAQAILDMRNAVRLKHPEIRMRPDVGGFIWKWVAKRAAELKSGFTINAPSDAEAEPQSKKRKVPANSPGNAAQKKIKSEAEE